MEEMLTAKQVAEVKGCSYRYIKKIVQDGKLKAVETINDKNRKTYLIPLSSLDEELQEKWYWRNQNCEIVEVEPEVEEKAIDLYSAEERAEIDFWTETISQWMEYRNKVGVTSKADVDKRYVELLKFEKPDINLSVDTLYRKWKAIREKDTDGLIDKRGKWKKGKSSVDEVIWQAFLYYYLDESKHSIQKCIEYTQLWAQEKRPELFTDIPSYYSFYRKINNDLMVYLKIFGREGEKALSDRCEPYIRRFYDDIASNEWWIADNHTFDVFVKDANGKLHRPYLTAFMDARSGIFTGYYITYNPSSEATLFALRRGILEYGIPENIYVDNGREFLAFDIGGLGHRKKKPKDGMERYEPPGVFKRLGINMTNAIVRNAKAKIIERRFCDVKNGLSKLFNTYTGGHVLEKPERLKKVLKKDAIYTDAEFNEIVENLIEGYFNLQVYNGEVTSDKGKVKKDVFFEGLKKQRMASEEELSLMLLRSSRAQTVGRRGIHLTISGVNFDYWNDEFLTLMMGKKVYCRYNPDELSSVRVYDLEDRYIMSVPADSIAMMSYNANKEELGDAIKYTKSFKKNAKKVMENSILAECDQIKAIELVLGAAKRNRAEYQGKADPKILELHRAIEEPLYQKVIGGADLDIMNRNAMKKQGGNENE